MNIIESIFEISVYIYVIVIILHFCTYNKNPSKLTRYNVLFAKIIRVGAIVPLLLFLPILIVFLLDVYNGI